MFKRITLILFCLVFLMGMIWQISAPALAQTEPQVDLSGKNVLILHSDLRNVPIFLDTDKGIQAALGSGGISRVNQFFESLMLVQYPGAEHRKLLAEQMRLRYGHRKPDMIITMYPEALEFTLKDCRGMFPDAPILALYLLPNSAEPKTDRWVIKHFVEPDVLGTLEIALKLVPGAKRVYVVSGAHKVDKWIEDQAKLASKKWERVEFVYLSQMPFEDMLATVSSAPSHSIILGLVISHDSTGKVQTHPEMIQRLNRVSTAPIFGTLGVALGHGIVGGSLADYELIGTRAGQLALDVLRGAGTPENIQSPLSIPPVPMFDWRQLRRWKVNETALPKGSIVINREVTFWDFKHYIIGGAAFILLETTLIVILIAQRQRRRLAEESLRQKTEELDRFFNFSLDFLCIANTDGHFLRINPTFEKILGYARDELTERQLLDFVHPDDIGDTRQALARLASQREVANFVNRYRCKGDQYRWLEWSLAPAGNLIYAAARDITDQKRAEAEAAHARAEMLRFDRSFRLSEMTASLAHELNQPLAAILSNAQATLRFLNSGRPDLNEIQEIIHDIISDDQRAGNVIRSLRSMMKQEEGDKRSIDINDVLKDVIHIFRSEAIFRNVSVETGLDGSLPPVLGDKVQLQQVALNVIMNAAEAMSHNPPEHRKIIIRTKSTDQGIRVSIRDFGPGVNQTDLERMFHPFFTTKETGLGMGLAVSTSIIKDHKGRIWAENNPDGGATFFIELPILTDH